MSHHNETTPTARGSAEIVRFLVDHGYRHVFGLPGSSMVSVLYDLQDTPIQYVPSIHESVAVAMADGYARVAGSAVTFLYMLPGTANGLGNLYNAWRDESPIIVITSQTDSVSRTREGTVGELDTATLVRPFTRMSQEVTVGMPVRFWLEAARRAGRSTPTGPAFLSLPTDTFEEHAPVIPVRESVHVKAGAPDVSLVVEALANAKRPCIMVGGQLRRYGGSRYIEELAAQFEIPVVYEGAFNDRLGVAPGHSHTFGAVMSGGSMFEQDSDVAVLVGCRFMLEGHPRAQPWFPKANFIAHVNADYAKLEETRTADWASACDPGAFAKALLAAMRAQAPNPELLAARANRLQQARESRKMAALDPVVQAMMPYVNAVSALHDAMDRGWVVDESIMASQMLFAALKSKDGERFIGMSGGSLGWGPGAAAGVALASGEPVTLVIGDGAMRFGVHGLWTIQALKLPVTIVVLDNGGYGSTRHFEREYVKRLGDQATNQPSYLNMDMRNLGPEVASIIRGFGIPCRTVAQGEDARQAVVESWEQSSQGPNAVVISVPF